MLIWRKYIALMAFSLLLFSCAQIGFYELFSNYRDYDDEGLFMLSNQLFLAGHTPYTEITWIFGPVQLAIVSLLHDGLAIPISHSAIRFVSIVLWLLLAVTAGYLIRQLSGSWLWAVLAFSLAFMYPRSLVNEPGHPQILVGILTLCIPIFGSAIRPDLNRLSWILIGGTVASILNIKINAGIFCLSAVTVVLLSQHRGQHWRPYVISALAITSFIFPLTLMFPLIEEPGSIAFAFIISCSAASFALAASHSVLPDFNIRHAGVGFLGGFLTVSGLAFLFAAYHGAYPMDMLSSIRQLSERQIDFFHFFRTYSTLQISLATLALVTAIATFANTNSRATDRALPFIKTIFVVATCYSLVIDDAANSQAMLGYAAPWAWVIVMKVPDRSSTQGRMLLGGLAVWMPLLAYPIPGSQLYFGCIPILLSALVCAWDLCERLRDKLKVSDRCRTYMLPTALPSTALFSICIYLYSWQSSAKQQYESQQPLQLPGTEYLRIEPNRVALFQQLVGSIEDANADVLLTNSRFNSLYFWSGTKVPSVGYVSQFTLHYSSLNEQRKSRAGLDQAQRPVILIRKSHTIAAQCELMQWINQEFEPYLEIGDYTLMRKISVNYNDK